MPIKPPAQITPYRTPPHKLKKHPASHRPNFAILWRLLLGVAEKAGHEKYKALLNNHAEKQEYICRKLGVVCSADVERISKKLQKPIGAPRA
jgi:hypothetical protein